MPAVTLPSVLKFIYALLCTSGLEEVVMIDFEWLTEDEHRVYGAFSTMSRELFNHVDCDLKRDVGIPRTYYEILFVLGRCRAGRMRLTELAQGTRSAPSRITYAVGRLEKDGLVLRRASATDGRSWTVELTAEGEGALCEAARRHARSLRTYFFAALTDGEREDLRRIADAVTARIAATTGEADLLEVEQ
jgi:DNA-binding MarR family transcriptional regulator